MTPSIEEKLRKQDTDSDEYAFFAVIQSVIFIFLFSMIFTVVTLTGAIPYLSPPASWI